jgi:hypothetical protein
VRWAGLPRADRLKNGSQALNARTLSQTDLAAYKSRPLGRRGVEAVNFLRKAWLRSLRASLLFRSRWKRALSPLIADIVTQG